MNTVIPLDWGLSPREFREWVAKTQSEVRLKRGDDTNDWPEEFYFLREEDESAFRLTFAKNRDRILGYKGKTAIYSGAFYCPYIPIIDEKSND